AAAGRSRAGGPPVPRRPPATVSTPARGRAAAGGSRAYATGATDGGTGRAREMATDLSPHFVELVYDALLKSFWRRKALKRFLRLSKVPEPLLAQLHDGEIKRDWLDRLFPQLQPAL